MSILATPLAFLVFFSGSAVAHISAPDCNLTWAWSFNSLNQDPCKVAATMLGTCNGSTYTMAPLQPGQSYSGPSGVDDSNLCKCSTVGYSLVSACGGCQGQTWITWSEYPSNCKMVLPASRFPNPVPSGIRLPYWSLLNVIHENNWDFNKSYVAGDTPELAPGATPGSSSHLSAFTPGLKAGLITCDIVGGIAAITLLFQVLVVALLFYRRRRRSLTSSRRSLTSSAALPALESAGDGLSAFVAFNTPMLSHIPSQASSGGNPFTVSPVPAPQSHV
ncbi:hypothetical protein BJV77DRAFT_200144 [Russula vinacea]|nr:hypothetical protein BJV77DRAFT_200144 [Russula vinacea]